MPLLTMITDVRSWVLLRRKVVTLAGAVGVLALSGSQGLAPVAVAFMAAPAEGLEGQSYYYDALWSGQPDPAAVLAKPAGVPISAANPYGLASPAGLTSSGIPQPAYRAYVAAAAELARTDPACALSWTLIAGIGRVESNHGRYGGSTIAADGLITPPILGVRLDGSRPGTARISDSDGGRYDGDSAFDRAVGPMQFLPGTWKTYGAGANPQNMNAAALATARYLCAGSGSLATQPGRWAAVYRYNHSDSYVSLVLSLADSYATGKTELFPARPVGTPAPDPDAPAATAPGPPPSVPVVPAPTPAPTVPVVTKPTAGGTSAPPTATGSPTASPTGSGPTTVPATTPASEPTTVPGTTEPVTDPTTAPGTTPAPEPTTVPSTTTPTGSSDPPPSTGDASTAAVVSAT